MTTTMIVRRTAASVLFLAGIAGLILACAQGQVRAQPLLPPAAGPPVEPVEPVEPVGRAKPAGTSAPKPEENREEVRSVHTPVPCDPPAERPPGKQVIDVNTATRAELESVPGIGPATAGRILARREMHGRFRRLRDLRRVRGIGRKTLKRLEPHLTVGKPPP